MEITWPRIRTGRHIAEAQERKAALEEALRQVQADEAAYPLQQPHRIRPRDMPDICRHTRPADMWPKRGAGAAAPERGDRASAYPPPGGSADGASARRGVHERGCRSGFFRNDCGEDEQPAHRVAVSSFEISTYEVTQEVWEAVMGENPSRFTNCPQCPVEQVSWDDVQEFLQKLNTRDGRYRLPTEAEWEYAARGGQESRGYTYAGGDTLDAVAWYGGNSGRRPRPVGQKAPNELGLYDMSGNVREWVADWYDDYPADSAVDPRGPRTGARRVNRSGSWGSYARVAGRRLATTIRWAIATSPSAFAWREPPDTMPFYPLTLSHHVETGWRPPWNKD